MSIITGDIGNSPPVASGTGTASPLASASFTPTDGTLIIVLAAAGWSGATQANITVSDTGSHAWSNPVIAKGTSSNGGTAGIFYTYIARSSGAIVVNTAFSGFASGSGGRFADIILLWGAKSDQTGAATASKLSTTGLDGTFSITTTTRNSWVFGVSDDATNGAIWTPNANTGQDSQYNNTTDNVTSVGWFANFYTGTPGATTFGGTWAANGASNHTTQQCAFEVLPALDLPKRSLIVAKALPRSHRY